MHFSYKITLLPEECGVLEERKRTIRKQQAAFEIGNGSEAGLRRKTTGIRRIVRLKAKFRAMCRIGAILAVDETGNLELWQNFGSSPSERIRRRYGTTRAQNRSPTKCPLSNLRQETLKTRSNVLKKRISPQRK
jgi:hypothetical protein